MEGKQSIRGEGAWVRNSTQEQRGGGAVRLDRARVGGGAGGGRGARPKTRASCGVLGRLDFIPSQDGGGAGT